MIYLLYGTLEALITDYINCLKVVLLSIAVQVTYGHARLGMGKHFNKSYFLSFQRSDLNGRKGY